MSARRLEGTVLAVALLSWAVPPHLAAQGHGPGHGRPAPATRSTAASARERHQGSEVREQTGKAPASAQPGAAGARPGGGHAAQAPATGGEGPPLRPKGWDEGKKVGWEKCAEPPGLAKHTGCVARGSAGASAAHSAATHAHGRAAPTNADRDKPAKRNDHKDHGGAAGKEAKAKPR